MGLEKVTTPYGFFLSRLRSPRDRKLVGKSGDERVSIIPACEVLPVLSPACGETNLLHIHGKIYYSSVTLHPQLILVNNHYRKLQMPFHFIFLQRGLAFS